MGAKSKKEYILDENGEKVKLKNGNFKTRKIDTVDWNNQDKGSLIVFVQCTLFS